MSLGKRIIGQDLRDVPYPEMIRAMGVVVAEAQFELDWLGIRLAQMMSGSHGEVEGDADAGETQHVTHEGFVTFNGARLSLLELGFSPSFCPRADAVAEVPTSTAKVGGRDLSGGVRNEEVDVAGFSFFACAGAGSPAFGI
ncbi:hypothetical protein [Endothiovibrio diazotrophicus]